MTKIAEDTITPFKTVFAFLTSLKRIEDMNIKRKAESINQKVPESSIMPKKETFNAGEKIAERRKTNTMPKPEVKSQDLGKIILPSENRAAIQKIIEIVSPTTKRKPFETSTGILVKGRKKIGNNTMTAKRAQNEILSKIFDNIIY